MSPEEEEISASVKKHKKTKMAESDRLGNFPVQPEIGNFSSAGPVQTMFTCPRCLKFFERREIFSNHVKRTSCLAEKGDLCCVCRKVDCLVPYENKNLLWQHVIAERRRKIIGREKNKTNRKSSQISAQQSIEVFDGSQNNAVVKPDPDIIHTDLGKQGGVNSPNQGGVNCPSCLKNFSGRRALYNHVRLSMCLSDKGPVCCICRRSNCSVPYNNKRLLWNHICIAYGFGKITTHGAHLDSAEEIEYSCPRCFKDFMGKWRHAKRSLMA